MRIVASATIGGAKTNRVRVKNGQSEHSAQRAKINYRKDPLVYGRKAVVVCVSMPTEDLALLDAFAEDLKMARSHVIRAAVKQLIEQRNRLRR